MTQNRFADAEAIESLLYQLAGAASMCWENVSGAGVFESTKARDLSREAMERLRELIPEKIGVYCHPPVDPVTGQVSAEDDSVFLGEMRHCDAPGKHKNPRCTYPMYMHRFMDGNDSLGIVICPAPKPLGAEAFQPGPRTRIRCEHGPTVEVEILCPNHSLNVNLIPEPEGTTPTN